MILFWQSLKFSFIKSIKLGVSLATKVGVENVDVIAGVKDGSEVNCEVATATVVLMKGVDVERTETTVT